MTALGAGRVLITGASGSGTTTIGRLLANEWSVPHADIDDYYWIPTSPAYRDKRPVEERLALMETLFLPRDAWVLSGSIVSWGEPIVDKLDAVVFVTIDAYLRMDRLIDRERRRYGEAGIDNDMHRAFFEWARAYDDPQFIGRSRAAHERWLGGLACPVLTVNSAEPVAAICQAITAWFESLGRKTGGAR
jgi:adenylate kinase family enzyme